MMEPNPLLPFVQQCQDDGGYGRSRPTPFLWFSDLARPIPKRYAESTPIDEIEGLTIQTSLDFDGWQTRHHAFKQIQAIPFSSGKMLPGSVLFWNEIKAATKHVYLFDKHIDECCFRRIMEVFKEREEQNRYTLNVILITNTSPIVFNMLKTVYKKYKFSTTNIFVPRCKDCVFELMHDRFAVIDNMVWHFGATIGGMHECINAFSGPWQDVNQGMQSLFLQMSTLRWEGHDSYLGTVVTGMERY